MFSRGTPTLPRHSRLTQVPPSGPEPSPRNTYSNHSEFQSRPFVRLGSLGRYTVLPCFATQPTADPIPPAIFPMAALRYLTLPSNPHALLPQFPSYAFAVRVQTVLAAGASRLEDTCAERPRPPATAEHPLLHAGADVHRWPAAGGALVRERGCPFAIPPVRADCACEREMDRE